MCEKLISAYILFINLVWEGCLLIDHQLLFDEFLHVNNFNNYLSITG